MTAGAGYMQVVQGRRKEETWGVEENPQKMTEDLMEGGIWIGEDDRFRSTWASPSGNVEGEDGARLAEDQRQARLAG